VKIAPFVSSAMMDFFHRQEAARLNTARLLPYIVLAVVLTSAALYLLSIAIYAVAMPLIDAYNSVDTVMRGADRDIRLLKRFWIPGLLYAVFVLTILIVVAGSAFKFHQLRKGGSIVAVALGGSPIDPQTENADERRLLNVVEEMSIASSTPMPDVYVLDRENCINAFAAGHTVHDMVIGVTHGCLRALNRDEMQGVIAHEFSHILNGDMRLNMRLTGIVHGIYCITLGAYALMTEIKDRELEDKSLFEIIIDLARGALGFVLAFIGFNGAFFGRVIKRAVCREREFLADAAAVQFTRFPDGLAGALKKAEAWAERRILIPAAEEVSHIFFNNVRDDDQNQLTSTHPPLAERVRRLDPGFYKSIARPEFSAPDSESDEEKPPPRCRAAADLLPLENLLSRLPVPTDEHLTYATALLASLPKPVVRASRKPAGACALVYTLLLASDEKTRVAQLSALKSAIEPTVYEELADLLPIVAQMDVRTKLPLVEISLPALRRLSSEQHGHFICTIQHLVHSDAQVDVFEFALERMLRRHLQVHFTGPVKEKVRFLRIRPLAHSCSVLLSTLAHVGHDVPDKIANAFRNGGMALGLPADELTLLDLADCNLTRLEAALSEVSESAAGVKNLILNACIQTVSADGFIGVKETELVRAIADSLGCAIPPALGTDAFSQPTTEDEPVALLGDR
jgi:Zn-dependent protease with chaperone function